MRFIATIFILFVVFAGNTAAQCEVVTSSAPSLVNVKLGMTPQEVNAALAGAAKVKVKQDGEYNFFKSYLKRGKAKGILKGARAFYVRFYDRRVYQVEVFYHNDSQSSELENFVRGYSDSANFDFENFRTKHGYAAAKCVGFSIEADSILNPHIQLTDVVVKEIVENNRKK